MDLALLPNYYGNYIGEDKHALFGYPPDRYPEFESIRSLERRFLHFRQQPAPAPLFLVVEMPSPLPKIYDGNTASMIKGYTMFATYVRLLRQDLAARGIALSQDNNDRNRWRDADIKMAFFGWASGQQIDDAV
jgi:hypothetical protein